MPRLLQLLSREGKQFWLSQVMPVAPREQINGKIIYSLLLSLLGYPLGVPGISFTLPLEHPGINPHQSCWNLPYFTFHTVSLLIDLLRPYLTWPNPQVAIKQNLNAVFAMVATGGLTTSLISLPCI